MSNSNDRERIVAKLYEHVYQMFKEDTNSEVTLSKLTALLKDEFASDDSAHVFPAKVKSAVNEIIAIGHLLRRTKHGLTLPRETYYQKGYIANQDLKEPIVATFARFISPGTSLACTEGTTVTRCIEALLQENIHVSIVTNNIGIGEHSIADMDIRMTGGIYLASTHACTGTDAYDSFRKFRCRTALMGVSGIGPHGELYLHHPHDCQLREVAIESATDSIIIVADGTKMGQTDTWHFANLADLLTDKDVILITNSPRVFNKNKKVQNRIAKVLESLEKITGGMRREHYNSASQLPRRKLQIVRAEEWRPKMTGSDDE